MSSSTEKTGDAFSPGDFLGGERYQLLELLGDSTFTTDWKALDTHSQKKVALKLLRSRYARDVIQRTRFFRSARMMAAIKHNAVLRVLEQHGETRGDCFFIMELIDGTDFHTAVLSKEILLEQATSMLLRVGTALIELHGQGLVHRNLTPQNILVDSAGAPRLIDFELYEEADAIRGTSAEAYRAPEMMDRPQDADATADVYSLAMILAFAILGEDPDPAAVHNGTLVANLACDHTLKEFLLRALSREPQKRFRDARMFCGELQNITNVRADGRGAGRESSEFGESMTYLPPKKAQYDDGPTRLPVPKTDFDIDGSDGASLMNIHIGTGVLLDADERVKALMAKGDGDGDGRPTTRFKPIPRKKDGDKGAGEGADQRKGAAKSDASEVSVAQRASSSSGSSTWWLLAALVIVCAGIAAVVMFR